MASRPKSPAPAVATLFGLPATLRAETEVLLFPRQQVTGSGLMGGADALGDANAAPPLPPPFGRPKRNGLRAESDQGLQVFGPVRTPPFSLTRLVAGEPPDPVPLGHELQASGGRAAATRRPGRPQLQARGQPFPHSWHAGCGASVTPAPTLAVVAGSRPGTSPVRKPALDGIAHQVDALSAPTTAAPIATTGRDPGETPESARLGRSTGKRSRTMPHNGLERVDPCPDTWEIDGGGKVISSPRTPHLCPQGAPPFLRCSTPRKRNPNPHPRPSTFHGVDPSSLRSMGGERKRPVGLSAAGR